MAHKACFYNNIYPLNEKKLQSPGLHIYVVIYLIIKSKTIKKKKKIKF